MRTYFDADDLTWRSAKVTHAILPRGEVVKFGPWRDTLVGIGGNMSIIQVSGYETGSLDDLWEEEFMHSDLSVIVKVSELVEVLKTNRDAHRGVFEEAQKGFREEAIKQLDKQLQLARDGKNFALFIQLPAPSDHTEDYDRVIKMLEMTTEGVIEISEQDFARYVEDKWGWKREFTEVAASYTGH